ncbi:MAG: hypothetical protein ACRDP8_19250 [Actinopolymorphaceae bacterium]
MIPQLITVKYRRQRGNWIRLWIPLLPVAVVCLPLLLIAAVAGVVACAIYQINALRLARVSWRLLRGLRGTQIEIEQGRTAVLVRVS